MEEQFITYQGHVIHYYKIGSGNDVILAFHGFGLDGTCYEPFENHFSNTHTIYSFDLFYHGKSFWNNNDQPLSKDFWKAFITDFIKTKAEKISLMGFSLGGKFVLATIEAIPQKIEKVYFIAPDGIETNTWYSLATYPVVLRHYFKSMIVKPKRFFNILNLVKSVGLLDKSISKFAASQMNTAKKRRRVYYSWVIFRHLHFDLKTIASKINEHDIQVEMYLGKYDKIITEKGMQSLLSKLNTSNINILDCGHNNLIPHVAAFLRQIK